ncbi:MAG: TlyA family RNA methyltransferase [Burkholderiales bacterium]|nr:TlyA family RNA methyltransferase [Burkholderiales bacterium]
MRADLLIVQSGLAPTRSAAQRLIATGAVRWLGPTGWAVPHKAGEDLPDGCRLEVTNDAELRFVSRGGLKLEGALARLGIEVAGMTCLDLGQSTGGFTDALLQRGARRVVGVDVGHGQLHPRLAADERVTALEGVNARYLEAAQLPVERFDLIVGDLSFISLTLVLPALVPLLGDGHLLLLVKPQFELQPVDIGSGGQVKTAAGYGHAEKRLRKAAATNGLTVLDWFDSATPGSEGAREFFLHAVRASRQGQTP